MNEPATTKLRPVADLAVHMGVTKAAIYQAGHKGHLPIVWCGMKMMIRPDAYEYHRVNGYGPKVPPYGATVAA